MKRAQYQLKFYCCFVWVSKFVSYSEDRTKIKYCEQHSDLTEN